MKNNQINLIQKVTSKFPFLECVLQEHIRAYDEIIPHVFFGELTRFIVNMAKTSKLTGNFNNLDNILKYLEEVYKSKEQDLRNLIEVSFIENLDINDQSYKIIFEHTGGLIKNAMKKNFGINEGQSSNIEM